MRLFRPTTALLCLAGVLGGLNATYAAEYKGVTYSIEPFVGYGLERKDNPARAVHVLMYGARVIAGYKILSGEGEYSISQSDEAFGEPPTLVEEKTERIRAGIRSTYSLGSVLDAHLRGGGEMQKRETTRIAGGVTTRTESPSNVFPYIGTGVDIRLVRALSLNAGVVITVKDTKDMDLNEYSTSFGIRLHL